MLGEGVGAGARGRLKLSALSSAERGEHPLLDDAGGLVAGTEHGAAICGQAGFLACFDCGRILNPKAADSQFRGGIIMGLRLALTEETQLDGRNGRIMNPSLTDYHVPVHTDVPAIDVVWTDIPDPHTPMGVHGSGEIGITGVGAAVANAIFNATGTRVRNLPITLDKLL